VGGRRIGAAVALVLLVAAGGFLLADGCGEASRGDPVASKAADRVDCHPIKMPPQLTRRARPAAVAGSWYPNDPVKLTALLDGLLAPSSPPELGGGAPVRALIVPHAGYRFSGAGAAAGYKLLAGQPICRVVLLGPAHRGNFTGLSIPDVTHYSTPLGDIPLDINVVTRMRNHPLVTADPSAHSREHSIEMQLPLLQRVLGTGWSLVPILVGRIDRDSRARAAEMLRLHADEQTLFVVSSDFTHYGPNYGYQPFSADHKVAERIRELDMGAMKHIEARDADGFASYRDETGITACGFGPVSILLDVLGPQAKAKMVRYYTSGEVLGDYRNSVSYLTVAFRAERALSASGAADDLSAAQMKLLHRLAVRAVAQSVAAGADIDNPESLVADLELAPDLERTRAAFVTLRKYGALRGCMGHITPLDALYRSVIITAVNAALHDGRFEPVTSDELSELTVEVSVLSTTSLIPSFKQFEVGKQGVILRKGSRRAFFLPEVAAERGWSREETLTVLSNKAGLAPNAWRSGASFEVFTSQIYEAPWDGKETLAPSRRQ